MKTTMKERRLTICNKQYARNLGGMEYPDLRLCGKWLKEWGFSGGQIVTVRREDEGKIVIEVSGHYDDR